MYTSRKRSRSIKRYAPYRRGMKSYGPRRRVYKYQRRYGGRWRTPTGAAKPTFQPQGRMMHRNIRIPRMSQFPTTVQVKFVQEAINSEVALSSGGTENQRVVQCLPVNTFGVGTGWLRPGTSATAPPSFPQGWLTWQQAYGRYKTLACHVEVTYMALAGDYGRQVQLVLWPYPNDLAVGLTGSVIDRIVDPRSKIAYCDQSGSGFVAQNAPTASIYVKPRDMWQGNFDWSQIEAPMSTVPNRFINVGVGIRRLPSLTTNNIQSQVLVRVTTYVQLFDRLGKLDSGLPVLEPLPDGVPDGLMAALVPPGSMDAVAEPSNFVVDSKMGV